MCWRICFFYGGDIAHGRNVPLADEIQIHVPETQTPHRYPAGTHIPTYTYFPTYDFYTTLLRKHFGVITTWRETERSQCSQTGDDRRFVGNITNIGGIDEVLHFRAIREPIRRCIPFLRVLPREWIGEVYVIAGVPYGKGCLMLCGFDLRDDPNNRAPMWDVRIHNANMDKICNALCNLLVNRRNGYIPLNAENW